ncbi:REP-associated tyrosine transposase [Persicobacter psychrovividus]|uniref:Transposase n=1 Tax=Persicobacter psychrovividus TaxID=387638 RepID=A0ABM7VCG6_9BACT|nr:transposase [Persicobacter psychrovividus]
MSSAYKIKDESRFHFLTMSVVDWMDVFTRKDHQQIIIDSLRFCQKNKGLQIGAWCMMTNHIHLIARSEQNSLGKTIGEFKRFTSHQMLKEISASAKESRKNWLMGRFSQASRQYKSADKHQLWQYESHPVELNTNTIIQQKVDYLHYNPVKAGFVETPEAWRLSSAMEYSGGGRVPLIDCYLMW